MATTFLSKTFSTTGNRQKFTLSMWFKRGIVPVGNQSGTERMLFNAYQDSSNQDQIWLQSNGTINYVRNNANAVTPSQVLRDSSAWYHVVFAGDTTQGSNADRLKVYINGTQAPIGQQDTITQNSNFGAINNAQLSTFGRRNGSNDWYFDGSMANVEMVDGQQLTPAYFGSTDSNTGIWKPGGSSAISNYGTNGYKLKMDTTSPGADTSGKGNTFTPSGTPTLTQGNPDNNYACMNPLFAGDNSAITYSNGNLKTTATNEGQKNAVSTIGVSSGKWYCEMVSRNGNNYPGFGIMDSQSILQTSISYLGSSVDSYCMFQDGNYYTNASAVSTGTTWGVDSIMGISIDLNSATKTIKFYKNGAEEHSATIATPANDYVFAASHNQNGSITEMNFGEGFFGTTAAGTNADGNGQGLFAYAVPSGYYALNTKNLEAYG